LSARYDVEILADGAGYKFITSQGDIYIAYFTEFILLDPLEEEISVVSFGFDCKRAQVKKKRQHYDDMVKHTIIHIIETFFYDQSENALLYICMNNDGKARNRHIAFNKWYIEFSEGFEKHNSSQALGKLDFYGSILIKKNNPNKRKLIDSFYFTINYWGLNEQ
jgi:hypothetical protein